MHRANQPNRQLGLAFGRTSFPRFNGSISLIFFLLKKMKNKWNASGITLMVLLALDMVISTIVSKFLNEPFFDIWDILGIGIMSFLAIICFAIGFFTKKK